MARAIANFSLSQIWVKFPSPNQPFVAMPTSRMQILSPPGSCLFSFMPVADLRITREITHEPGFVNWNLQLPLSLWSVTEQEGMSIAREARGGWDTCEL